MAEELEIVLKNVAELDKAIPRLLEFFGSSKVILLNGPVGAGKTTLVKAICRHLGCLDNLSSPTYSLINEYCYGKGVLYHIDLYRLRNTDELFDLGIEDYLNSGNFCFFEWPDLVRDWIQGSYIEIQIEPRQNIRYLHAFKK